MAIFVVGNLAIFGIEKYRYFWLQECVGMCNLKRHTDGASWNGIIWDITDHRCWCEKHDRGHQTDYPNYLHFRIE